MYFCWLARGRSQFSLATHLDLNFAFAEEKKTPSAKRTPLGYFEERVLLDHPQGELFLSFRFLRTSPDVLDTGPDGFPRGFPRLISQARKKLDPDFPTRPSFVRGEFSGLAHDPLLEALNPPLIFVTLRKITKQALGNALRVFGTQPAPVLFPNARLRTGAKTKAMDQTFSSFYRRDGTGTSPGRPRPVPTTS